jgi:uncharacterized protein (TIGR02453 family)
MTFRGWKVETLEFFEGLEADNSKRYWEAHKDVYQDLVRAPMERLLADLEPTWGEGRIFRPYRDVRFSKDKSPYKTAIAATLANGGYISFSAEGLGAGRGLYMPASDQLERYRLAVADERSGRQLVQIVSKLRKSGITVDAHDVLKTAPKGYPKDHPRIELLRYKGLISWKQWPVGAWLGTRKAKERLVGFLRQSKPLHDWLEKRVGPSELADER